MTRNKILPWIQFKVPGIDDDLQSTPAYERRQPLLLASVPSAFHEIMENIVGK